MVRAEFLRARNFEYVRAARALGVGNATIMFRHLLPNAMVASYEHGATVASNRALHAGGNVAEPKKIMVIQLGSNDSSMKLAKYEGPTDLRGLNVDGFMNYEGEQDDE